MTSKPLDIDGAEMKVGDLVVVAYECPSKGQYRTIRSFEFGTFVHDQWNYLDEALNRRICNRSRIIRDIKSKENIDLAEWVGEKEGVKNEN